MQRQLLRCIEPVNPESGSNGNMVTRVAPQANQTGSATKSTYPTYYYYDQTGYSNDKGRLNGVDTYNPSGGVWVTAAWFNYDPVGRVTQKQAWVAGVYQTISYAYNYDGSIKTITYPSGRVVTYTPDNAQRMTAAQDTTNSINYATNATYAPFGGLTSAQNGAYLLSTSYYNSRLQPCRIAINSSGTAPSSCTDSTNHGNVIDFTYDFNLGTADNGDVKKITDNRTSMSGRSTNFTYDALNRIKSAYSDATTGSYCWGEKYTLDAWGNMTGIGDVTSPDPSHTGTGCTRENLGISPTTLNRITTGTTPDFSYDAAGNMTNDTVNSFTYDAESRIISGAGVTYNYDFEGKRVLKSSGTLYWYGISSDPLVETDGSGSLTNEYIFSVANASRGAIPRAMWPIILLTTWGPPAL